MRSMVTYLRGLESSDSEAPQKFLGVPGFMAAPVPLSMTERFKIEEEVFRGKDHVKGPAFDSKGRTFVRITPGKESPLLEIHRDRDEKVVGKILGDIQVKRTGDVVRALDTVKLPLEPSTELTGNLVYVRVTRGFRDEVIKEERIPLPEGKSYRMDTFVEDVERDLAGGALSIASTDDQQLDQPGRVESVGADGLRESIQHHVPSRSNPESYREDRQRFFPSGTVDETYSYSTLILSTNSRCNWESRKTSVNRRNGVTEQRQFW